MSLAVFLILATAQQDTYNPDYMVQASYPAGSMKTDPTEVGGHQESGNVPTPMASNSRQRKSLGVELSATQTGISIRIFNSSENNEWLRAVDGNMIAWLEALDGKDWIPIEYHPFVESPKSFHRVVLPPNYQWTFEKAIPKGTWQTRVRWVVLERDKQITSPSIIMSLPLTRKQLSPVDSAKGVISRHEYPTLIPKIRE